MSKESGRWRFAVTRRVSYVETIDVEVAGPDAEYAEGVAAGLGDGEEPHWPDFIRYNVSNRSETSSELLDVERIHVEGT